MTYQLVLQVEAKGRFMKIKRVNVTSQVVDYLKKNIESGNWTVGEKIPSENQMTEELGVSRSSDQNSTAVFDRAWCPGKCTRQRDLSDQQPCGELG